MKASSLSNFKLSIHVRGCTVHTQHLSSIFHIQHLLKQSPDVVKRWVNEVQEAASSDNIMVQYHALGLLYHIRKHDRLAASKMVSKYTRGGLKSPYATCLLVCLERDLQAP